MLKKSSIFMMVLLVAASLVGISSIYQPANVETLLQKFDGKLLAQKVFPYLDVNVILKQRPGQIAERKAGLLAAGGAAWGKAVCNPGETAVSAGFTHELRGDTDQSIFTVRRNDPNSNAWDI